MMCQCSGSSVVRAARVKLPARVGTMGKGGAGCGSPSGVSTSGRGTDGVSASTTQAARSGLIRAFSAVHAASSRAGLGPAPQTAFQ